MAALVLRRQVMLSGILGNVRQVHLAFQDLLTQLAVPAGIAPGDAFIQLAVFNHTSSDF